jgi:hypothetical protein
LKKKEICGLTSEVAGKTIIFFVLKWVQDGTLQKFMYVITNSMLTNT